LFYWFFHKTNQVFSKFSKTLNDRPFDFEFFQEAKAIIKKINQINIYLILILIFFKKIKGNTQFVKIGKR
jgi:hypothetical protein